MKKKIFLLILLVVAALTNLNAQNLVAYYKLDGNANAFFGSSNGITFGPVIADTNRFNAQNSAMRFASGLTYASIPNSFDLPQKTINFWVYIDTVTNNVNLLTIDNAALNHGMIYLQLYRVLGTNKLQFFGGNATPIEVNINTKRWYKLSVTYSNSIYKFYLNNNLMGTVTSSNLHSIDGYQGLVLGNNRAFNNDDPPKGKIDDLSIYDYAMDSAQLANITEASCNFINIVNVYDTTNVTIVDTNYFDITDTTFVTVQDTNYVTIQDTNLITITDTVFLSVYDTLIIDILSSTSQTLINTIKVYPNPATQFLIINNGNFSTIANFTYTIFNTTGMQVFSGTVSSAQTEIDISNWSTGVYFLSIFDTSNKLLDVKKIIIN